MTNFAGAWRLFIRAVVLLMLAFTPAAAETADRVSQFTLSNGLTVVVIPDHRAPVVTHMVWYKIGAADEPKGKSGIAHFLEHLMFKSTDKIPMGEFSKIVARLGGQDNAFTGQRCHELLPAHRQGPLEDGDGDGGRPHGRTSARPRRRS